MVKFESGIKPVNASVDRVHLFLTDFANYEALIPKEKITNWKCDVQTCSFTISGIGEVGLKIAETSPNSFIKYISNGRVPFNFYLTAFQEPVSESNSTLKLVVDADLNPMMKMIASPHLEKFIDILAESFANYPY
ncbi:MAG: SRPBCC family protein [Breznakibacter sp.]|nr:SRPBCC family protein [Breznakibacter sp.]